ncbi:hypothetical protein N7509_014026 [Penicillium cosmopolitanum]|uniref:Uncharacterized protein n=1 Tax=Penicillium cosmopolitanum TaxID=1131564 RepID=A0A9W9V6F3_9EURO|nr:uncharacterized protein N7509_014026 [Penicillium cosmopolitanum]KAJ5369414.1 hypothetical protein N7509_014026 [Penicillium cosmopolitanum]
MIAYHIFYEFSLSDPVDDKTKNHKFYACSSFGPDFSQMPASAVKVAAGNSVDVEFEVGWWKEEFGLADSGIRGFGLSSDNFVTMLKMAMEPRIGPSLFTDNLARLPSVSI